MSAAILKISNFLPLEEFVTHYDFLCNLIIGYDVYLVLAGCTSRAPGPNAWYYCVKATENR